MIPMANDREERIAQLEKDVEDLQAWVLALQFLFVNLLHSGPDRRALATLFEVTARQLKSIDLDRSKLPGAHQFVEASRIIEELRPVFFGEQDEPGDGA
jgi:hypothetical protein